METLETVKSLPQAAMVRTMPVESNVITSTETTSVFVTPQLVESISASERNIVSIESPRVADLMTQFKQYAMRSGTPIYQWTAEDGIVSLREMDFVVPGSQRLHGALRHVASTMHLGIYLFVGATRELRPPATGVVRQFARPGNAIPGRKIVFLDTKVKLTDGVDAFVHRIVHDIAAHKPPRLRDGRWVL